MNSTSPSTLPTRRNLVLAIFGLGAFLRIFHLNTLEPWIDEASTYMFATNPTVPTHFAAGYFMLVRVMVWFLGIEPWVLRLPSVLCGLLLLPLLYRIGCRAGGRAVGEVALLLAATSPYLIYYSQEARAYALVLLCLYIAVEFLLREPGEKSAPGGLWAGPAALLLAGSQHSLAIFPAVALAATGAIIEFRRQRRSSAGLYILASLGLVGLIFLNRYLYLVAGNIPVAADTIKHLSSPRTIAYKLAYSFFVFAVGPVHFLSFADDYTSPIIDVIKLVIAGVAASLVFAGPLIAWRRRDEKPLVFLVLSLLVTVAIAAIVLFEWPLGLWSFQARHFMWIVPALVLFAAQLIVNVRRRFRMVLISGVFFFWIMSLVTYYGHGLKMAMEGWGPTTAEMLPLVKSGDLAIVAQPFFASAQYFADRSGLPMTILTFPYRSPDPYDLRLENYAPLDETAWEEWKALLATKQRIWTIRTRFDLETLDSRGHLAQYLGAETDTRAVIRYHPGKGSSYGWFLTFTLHERRQNSRTLPSGG